MAMASATEGFAAFGEAVVFLNHFKDLPDPRQPGKVVYPLEEVLLLCLLAILGGAETIVDIALRAHAYGTRRPAVASHDSGLKYTIRAKFPQLEEQIAHAIPRF
jgi:hypothetical protein